MSSSLYRRTRDPHDMTDYDEHELPSAVALKSVVSNLFTSRTHGVASVVGATAPISGSDRSASSAAGSRSVSRKRSRKQASDSLPSSVSAGAPARKKAHFSRLPPSRVQQHNAAVVHSSKATAALRSGKHKKRKRSDASHIASLSSATALVRRKHTTTATAIAVVKKGDSGNSDAAESDCGMSLVPSRSPLAKPLVAMSFPEIYGK